MMHKTQKAYAVAKAAYEIVLEQDKAYAESLQKRFDAGEISEDQLIEMLVDRDMERSPFFDALYKAENEMIAWMWTVIEAHKLYAPHKPLLLQLKAIEKSNIKAHNQLVEITFRLNAK